MRLFFNSDVPIGHQIRDESWPLLECFLLFSIELVHYNTLEFRSFLLLYLVVSHLFLLPFLFQSIVYHRFTLLCLLLSLEFPSSRTELACLLRSTAEHLIFPLIESSLSFLYQWKRFRFSFSLISLFTKASCWCACVNSA